MNIFITHITSLKEIVKYDVKKKKKNVLEKNKKEEEGMEF